MAPLLILALTSVAAFAAIVVSITSISREWMKAILLTQDQVAQLLAHMSEHQVVGGQPMKMFLIEKEMAEKREAAERQMEMDVQKLRAETLLRGKERASTNPLG